MGFPKIRGTFLAGFCNKNYTRLVSILGSPYFGNLPFGDYCRGHYGGYQKFRSDAPSRKPRTRLGGTTVAPKWDAFWV